jgi:pyruvate ferredoxin oxidoreductase gamma subunit
VFQTRIHGRGGQGVVTAAELLSVAAFLEGRHAQAFPSFGSERMGAPVMSFCRIDDKEIRLREPVQKPDALIIQDPTLLHSVDVFGGLNPNGYILINSRRRFDELGIAEFVAGFPAHHVCDLGATELAMKHVGRPLPNAALLGGFAAISGQLHMDSVAQAIMQKFPGPVGEANVAAAREAYDIAANS